MPSMQTSLTFWIGFNAVVLALLALDLAVLHRKQHAVSIRESLATTLGWIAPAAGFGLWVMHREGTGKGLEFFTGYLIEYALSVDNIFIFVLIFTSFKIAADRQHRLLFWGVLGALVMRGAMIGAGTALLRTFEWVIYVFGAYILYAGFRMLFHQAKADVNVERHLVVRLARRFLPLSSGDHGGRFVVREAGRLKFTLLFLVLAAVELTDLVFALDSIPAIFGVTTDPFIVYTSNVCAILGLRSLYFLLAGAVKSLVYLHTGLACVLIFIGAKMVGGHFLPISTELSLMIVGGILGVTVIGSLLKTKPGNAHS
jgi:tellurite resistance protein TerC